MLGKGCYAQYRLQDGIVSFKFFCNHLACTKNFDDVFDFEVGKTVDLPFASSFQFAGTVVSKAEDAQANVKSIVIKSTTNVGATLALSRIINPDNTITYRGRIMSFKHGDAYEIANENGLYYFVKKGLYDLYEE